ncbi:hypothetical protein SynMITS9220_01123 [Synechococcus sp. MIT S9220]|nr:hypothetical protein SynMITS9220_01123 [Synechococcus sp. MIT S9220]
MDGYNLLVLIKEGRLMLSSLMVFFWQIVGQEKSVAATWICNSASKRN